MSAADLELLDRTRAFLPRRRFDELIEDHVPFDELNHRPQTEHRLTTLIEDEGVIAVVGPSGAGKSSLIASVTSRLPETYAPIRIRVAILDDAIRDPNAMVVHILREVRRHAAGANLTREQRRTLEQATAQRRVRAGSQRKVGANLGALIPGFTAALRGELTSVRLDEEYERDPTEMFAALGRLRGMFEAHQRIPILVMEDTDAWLRGRATGADPDPDVAEVFFERSLARLAREQELSIIVAVHETYRDAPGYERARAVFAGEVEVPPLDDPGAALGSILQRRIDRAEARATTADVFTNDAIVRLEAEYDRGGRDLRRVLRTVDHALADAGPDFPDRLAVGHIRAAAIADHSP